MDEIGFDETNIDHIITVLKFVVEHFKKENGNMETQ